MSGRDDAGRPTGTVGEGRYELGEMIGRDRLVEVWAARDALLQRSVTVRRYGPADDAEGPWRREIDALGTLDHDHVVELYDGGVEGTGAYTVLQVADAGSLARSKPAGSHTVARRCVDLADALGHMHDRGVVHHATGPDAVLLDAMGTPRWSGFSDATLGSADPAGRAADIAGLARVAIAWTGARRVPEPLVAQLVAVLRSVAADTGSGRSGAAVGELTALLDRARRPHRVLRRGPARPFDRRLVAAAVALVVGLIGGVALALPTVSGAQTAAVAQAPPGWLPGLVAPDPAVEAPLPSPVPPPVAPAAAPVGTLDGATPAGDGGRDVPATTGGAGSGASPATALDADGGADDHAGSTSSRTGDRRDDDRSDRWDGAAGSGDHASEPRRSGDHDGRDSDGRDSDGRGSDDRDSDDRSSDDRSSDDRSSDDGRDRDRES